MDDLRDPFRPLDGIEAASMAPPPDADTWAPQLPAPLALPGVIRHGRHGAPSRLWRYLDANGALLFAVCRFDTADGGKEVLPFSCGADGWRWKAPPAPRPLYGLDRLAARPDAPVLVVEGEKAADAAASLFAGHVVMTWPGGSGAVGKADWKPLAGRHVTIWPDNDAPGREAAASLAKLLHKAGAASVAVVAVPDGWPEGWDVADPLPEGAGADTLHDLLAGAEVQVEAPEEQDGSADTAEIARLAALDPLAYDREREAAADRLRVRVSTLDSLVQAARPKPDAADGRSVALTEVEPWPEPVEAAALLHDLAAAIRRHVVMSPAAADCTALWIAHTWVYDRFQHSPRLSITSPVKRCGKSTLLDVLRATCHRPLKADNISASGVFRTVEALRPLTLLVDEADSFLGDNEELRGILNSGFEKSGEVVRVVEMKEEWRPIRFATFCPVALAGIGALPGTLEDRAVPVALQRKAAAETVMKLRTPGARAALHDLARKLARWAADRRRYLPTDPAVPDAMGDREGDIAVPLLAVADDAGGEWPGRARRALLNIYGVRAAKEGTMEAGALLLADIKALFNGTSATQLPSARIVEHLGTLEERPWPEWRHGRPMTAPQLARALAPFGIRPGTIRTGRTTAKGYYKESFAEAWTRYLPQENSSPAREGGSEPSHRHTLGNSRLSAEIPAVTPDGVLRIENRAKAAENLGCDGVTASAPPNSPEGGCDGVAAGWSESL